MWVAITAACITSSMFLSALAPNLLATALVKSIVGINISGARFIAFLPLGILLILAMPLLAYWFYPPEVKVNNEVPLWAARELEKLGKLSRNEILLLVFVCFALMMWIFAADWIEPALAALLVIVLMLWTGVLSGAISPTTKRHGTPLSGSPPRWHWPTASPPPALSPGWVKRAER